MRTIAILTFSFLVLVSACAVEVTPHGAGVYSWRVVTLQAAPDVTPTPDAWPTATPSPTTCTGIVTASPRLNVRAEPHAWATVRAQVEQGATVAVVEARGGWLRIESPAGWVAGQWVRLEAGC